MADAKHRAKKVEGLDDNWRNLNPLYGTSAIIKKVGDAFAKATGQTEKKKK